MSQLSRYLTSGGMTVGFYVGGVWLGTQILGLPARPVNFTFYIAATFIAFTLAYKWVFAATVNPQRALGLFCLLQLLGIVLNALWMEIGLRFTAIYPWIIAASFFIVWPLISYNLQRRFIFKS